MKLKNVYDLVDKTNELLKILDLEIEFDADYDSLDTFSKNPCQELETSKSTTIKIDTEEEKEYRRRKRFILPGDNKGVLNIDVHCLPEDLNCVNTEIVNDQYKMEFNVRNWDFDFSTRDGFIYPERPAVTIIYRNMNKGDLYSFELSQNVCSTKIPDDINKDLLFGYLVVNFFPLIFFSLDGVYVADIDSDNEILGYHKYVCNSIDEIQSNLKVAIFEILDKLKGFYSFPPEVKKFISLALINQTEDIFNHLKKEDICEKIKAYTKQIDDETAQRITEAHRMFTETIGTITDDKAKAYSKVDDLKKKMGL